MVQPEDLQTRIIKFFERQSGVDWCDACLAAKLDATVAEIGAASPALTKTGVFYRSRWLCALCGTRNAVTRRLVNRPACPRPLGS